MSEISFIESVHERYVAASERFKSLWTFQQCLGGLCRLFGEPSSEPPAIDFQPVLDRLQLIGTQLSRTDAEELDVKLAQVEDELEAIQVRLVAEDSKVSPSTVRRFFQRVKRADAKSYRQMIGFYVGADAAKPWSADRTDKVDFLLTRLTETVLGSTSEAGAARARDFFNGLGRSAGLLAVPESAYKEDLDSLEPLAADLEEVQSFAELNARGLIKRFRGVKHSLGRHLLCPAVAERYLRLNRQVERMVKDLLAKEETLIARKYEQASTVELGTHDGGDTLVQAVASFRVEFERFEDHVKDGHVRLEELTSLREVADRIELHLDEFEPPADGGMDVQDIEETLLEVKPRQAVDAQPSSLGLIEAVGEELIRGELSELEEIMRDIDPEDSVESIAMNPALDHFRLEESEIQAYFASESEEERNLRKFVLASTALRKRLVDLVRQLNRVSESTDSAPGLAHDIKEAVGLAQVYMQRFEALIDQAVRRGELADAQALQVLRVRMMREYSGAWMQVYR